MQKAKAGKPQSPATHLQANTIMSSTASSYSPPPLQQAFHSPPITIVLTVVLLIFFLLGFFSVYFCRYFMEAVFNTWHLRRTPSGNLVGGNNSNMPPGGAGLDPALIKSFPSFVYSSVKQVRKEKFGLECAICLVEFEDDSLLRLLTACYHVFHQECVDLWLESHKTCPVCRRDLDNSPHLFADKPSSDIDQPSNTNSDDDNNVAIDDDTAVTIDVKDEIGDLHEFRTAKHFGGGDSSNNNRVIVEGFSRSHSTGHSIARARTKSEVEVEEEEGRDDQERYRLRLPDHVKIKLLRGHHWTASCDTYAEFRRPTTVGRRFGEVSGSHH